jgi:hypothetical protein
MALPPSRRTSNWVSRNPWISDHHTAYAKYTLSGMQKLFSMFPNGAPGLGLLLLRLFVGAVLVCDSMAAASALNVVLICVLVACALAVVLGCVTPIAAGLAALMETIGLNAHFIPAGLHSFAPVVIAIAVALLGPGAYSIDARLFGRRLMEFGPGVDDDRPDADR